VKREVGEFAKRLKPASNNSDTAPATVSEPLNQSATVHAWEGDLASTNAHESGDRPTRFFPMIRGARNYRSSTIVAISPCESNPMIARGCAAKGSIVLIQTVLLSALAAVLSVAVLAAEYEDEVLVTATRQPLALKDALPSSQVFTQDDIERLQPKDLPSLLGRMSGVSYRASGGRGSVSGVFIRGASTSQSIILVDGVRTSSATIGATALEGIPLESIERIELVKGPLSGLYGADAIGGVIQIFTKQGKQQRLTPEIHASYRTDDTQEYSIEAGAGNERGRVHATFAFENSQGIDHTSIKTEGNADRDGFDEFALNVSASYRILDELNAQVNFLRTDAYSEFDNLFGDGTGFDADTQVETNALKLTYTPSEKLRLSFGASHFVDEAVTPAFFSDITTRRTTYNLQIDYQVHDKHSITLGAEYYDDKVDTLDNFVETSRDNIGGFFLWQRRYGKLSAVGSVRYDDNEAYGDETNGSVALKYDVFESLAAVVSYGTAFRAPSFNELFFPGFGNVNVRPEESESLEVSLKGNHRDVHWRISGYYTDVKDLIGFDFATFTANNTSEATLKGVEAEVSYSYADWFFSANMNYLNARDDRLDVFLDDRAEFTTNVDVGCKFGRLDLSMDLQAESGRHDRSGTEIDGFVVLGTGINYRFSERFRIAARLDNIFDEDYTLNLATARDVFRTYGRTGLISLHAAY
jgi:vitamin B12 transporter